eukprot:GHVR01053681.1.p1 GENE.GHVR01053681.1~~GHVR01053681.1.p1  ORF type:complete len:101 (+),score=26.98 GHVR01053681.1:69-371(+)
MGDQPAAGGEGTSNAPAQSEHLNLKVKATDGNEVHFRIKRTTKLEKLMTAYCTRLGQNIDAVRFMFDGDHVRKEQSPNDIGLDDGDVLDAMLPQIGGYIC